MIGIALAFLFLSALHLVRQLVTGNAERDMEKSTIQDWTDSVVLLKFDEHKDVKYQVYRDAEKHFLEICDPEDTHIHTLELPDGMKLDKSSYEVLLRYVLLDVVAA